MRDTLEDLYFGKITPNEQDITPGSVLADAMDRAEQCKEKLTARLEGEEKNPAPATPQRGKRNQQHHGPGKLYPGISLWDEDCYRGLG